MRDLKTISDFCNTFHHVQPYPIHLYYKDELITECPVSDIDFISPYYTALSSMEKELFLYRISDELVIGGVNSAQDHILLLLGPVLTAPLTTSSIHDIQTLYHLSSDAKHAISSYFETSAGKTLFHFRTVLHLVNYFFNQELASEFKDALYFLNEDMHMKMASDNLEKSAYEQHVSYQLAYEFEKTFLNAVKNGDVEDVRQISPNMHMHVGTLSNTSIRQLKNQFICIATLITRAAIEGGLDLETAYNLSDSYIQKAEANMTSAGIHELIDTMLLDLTTRTNHAKFDSDVPSDLYHCLQYIRNHTHSNIQVSDVAGYAHLSVRQLNRKFSSELGFHPSEFIMRCKLEESKDMLLYTKKSLSEISQILCFSSQSYFCNVFKKHYGMTPGKFRRQNGR